MSSYRVNRQRFAFIALASGFLLTASAAEKKPAPALDREQIRQRIEATQPSAKERRFDAIGWVSGLRTAERLARESGRPVFLFSNVGQMDIGRC